MSGAYNQKASPANATAGWTTFAPQSSKGKYEKYTNRVCIIISITYGKKNEITSARLYLTGAVDKLLQMPTSIRLMTRGSNVGLMSVSDDDGESYTVSRKKENKDEQIGMAFLNVTAFAKFCNLKPGVYEAHPETGVVVFDTQSMPSNP